MGGQYFNFNYGKKPEEANNYVELTPEMRAEIDKANAQKANTQLSQGLSGGGVKDPDKGISVQRQEPVRVDTGNGITRIENPDGTTEFEIDYAKGYDGTPQLFAKGTKVTFLNAPKEPEKGFFAKIGDFLDKVDQKVNQWTGGQIRRAGHGAAFWGGVGATAVAAPAVASTASTVGTVGAGAKLAGAGALAASMASCENGIEDEPSFADSTLKITNKQMADYVIGILNDPSKINTTNMSEENKKTVSGMNLDRKTSDGVEFKYGYDYVASGDLVRPYITVGETPNDVKLTLGNYLKDLTAENVVKYITGIGDTLSTEDGVSYKFKLDGNNAQVAFNNGLTHNVGDKVDFEPNGAAATLYRMLGSVGLVENTQNSIVMDCKANEGSYGNDAKGFEMKLVTPQRLQDVTSGNPKISGSFSGMQPAVFDEDYNVIEDAKEFKLEFNGPASVSNGGILIKNSDGSEVLLRQENFSDESNSFNNCVVVYQKVKGGEFVERFVMTNVGNDGPEIGLIDRQNGTTLQHYPAQTTLFDTEGAKDAEKYYNLKKQNLNQTYQTANLNYNFFDKWSATAEAEADVKIQ